jgi:futalosine hydrolase
MELLVTAATAMEIQPFLDRYSAQPGISTCVTGIGSLATAVNLSLALRQHREVMVVQAGIAGSFREDWIGQVAAVASETLADLGVQEQGMWKDIFDMRLQQPDDFPFKGGQLHNPAFETRNLTGLSRASAITVNEITSHPQRVQQLTQRYQPDLESMEGAALHYLCLRLQVPFLQIRAVSNLVGERDKSKWKMKESVRQLNEALFEYTEKFLS